MLAAIDIGATKTLVAVFDGQPKPVASSKCPTDKDVTTFVANTSQLVRDVLGNNSLDEIVVGSRGEMTDMDRLTITDKKQLGWNQAPIGQLLKDEFSVPVHVHHDTAMAALGEAVYGAATGYSIVLYITISTGVGTALVVDGKIPAPFAQSAGGDMVVGLTGLSADAEHSTFEQRISGIAVKERFGKYGYEIKDDKTWNTYSAELALGLNNMIVLTQPDVVVLGGGMSVHFDKFAPFLKQHLKANHTSPFDLPGIVQAKYVETSVVYGCYAWSQQSQA